MHTIILTMVLSQAHLESRACKIEPKLVAALCPTRLAPHLTSLMFTKTLLVANPSAPIVTVLLTAVPGILALITRVAEDVALTSVTRAHEILTVAKASAIYIRTHARTHDSGHTRRLRPWSAPVARYEEAIRVERSSQHVKFPSSRSSLPVRFRGIKHKRQAGCFSELGLIFEAPTLSKSVESRGGDEYGQRKPNEQNGSARKCRYNSSLDLAVRCSREGLPASKAQRPSDIAGPARRNEFEDFTSRCRLGQERSNSRFCCLHSVPLLHGKRALLS